MHINDILKIEIYSRQFGLGPVQTAKTTIYRLENGFLRAVSLEGGDEPILQSSVQHFLAAITNPIVTKMGSVKYNRPRESMVLDDNPSLLVRITASNGLVYRLTSHSPQAFMLPINRVDPITNSTMETYDPRLSQAIASLMPDRFLNRDRLSSSSPGVQHSSTDEDFSYDPPDFQKVLQMAREQGRNPSKRLLMSIPNEGVTSLLAQGADPNVADDQGCTALMLAASNTPLNKERFQILVTAGANPNAKNNKGEAGLHLACRRRDYDSVLAWLNAGSDVNLRTDTGQTPLMLAANRGDLVKLLLDRDAEVNARDETGQCALVWAICENSPKGVKALIDG